MNAALNSCNETRDFACAHASKIGDLQNVMSQFFNLLLLEKRVLWTKLSFCILSHPLRRLPLQTTAKCGQRSRLKAHQTAGDGAF